MMILGLISQELHEQLLDPKSYQNRTNGVEELKDILSDLDLKSVPADSIDEFIRFLHQLLDDSNFKVLYGTLQVLNVLIQKLDSDVDKYFRQITGVALKSLGDTHTVTRREYMNVFRQLMRTVGPQEVLDLVVGHLRHKNSRVREDILNIITAAMLTHPRGDFNIPDLCFEVAPYLADSKRKVRHAALELFAVFDYCLDMGKKQPLIKAVDMVELNEDAEGLMAAVQARRARHVLPNLSSEGLVEYALVVPKPGQQCSPQTGSGADLDWVLNGGWINSGRNSGRNHRNEPDSDRMYGYGSLGSLTDAIPLPRRIVSAGKGKNKLPWEMSTENEQPCSTPNGKDSEQVTPGDDNLSLSRKTSPETYIPSFGCAEPQKALLSRRRESPARLRRSGSLDSDPDIFKLTGSLDTDGVARKSRILSGSPSVERTFSLPSNSASSPSPGPFLLPSYPLAGACPGGLRTPTLLRRRADSFLSMSNTWPNKRDSSPQQRDSSPWRDVTADHATRQCSPWPPRASPVSSASVSSFRRALSSSRASLPVSPVLALAERAQSHNGQKPDRPASPWTQRRQQQQQPERNLHLDLDGLGGLGDAVPEPQEEDPLDMEEMLNSLRSLRNSAAKKRAKMSLSGSDPDPDSPDSAMRLELGLDSPSNNDSPVVTSPACSESSLSSLCSPPSSAVTDPKTRSPGNSACSAAKPPTARVPSTKLRCSLSMDFSSLQGFSKKDKASPEVGIVGQRVSYSNGRTQADDEDATTTPSEPPIRPTCREPIRALRPAKGCQSYSNRSSPVTDMMPDGVVGKGVFGSAVFSSRQGVAEMFEQQADGGAKSPSSPLRAVYGHAMTGCHHEADANSPAPHEAKERVRVARCGRDSTRPQRLDWSEVLQVEHARERQTDVQTDRRRVKQMLSEWPADDITPPDRDLQLNGSTLTSTKGESPPDESPASPPVPQSPGRSSSQRHQPSPPTVPPNAKTLPRARRSPHLSGTRPSLSHSSDELSPGTPSQTRDVTESSELRPFTDPELALTQSFKLLSSEDWEDKIRGLNVLRSLTQNHSDTVLNKLHDVCLILIQEIKNLRSGVSRVAVVTLGDLYLHLQKNMDQELEATARALLQKAGETNAFIRQHTDAALERMVQHCTPIRGIYALMAGGLGNLNAGVRKCTAQHLATLVEKVGAARLLSGGKDLTDRIVPAVARLAQDSSQEARYFGRRMLLFLSSHRDFDKILEKNVPAKDLPTVRDIVLTLKTKGLGEMPQDAPTSGRRSLPGSGTVRASSLTREPVNRESGRQYSCRAVHHNISDKTEYIKQISGLLASKDFRERMKGIDQLVADCQHNANMVINSIFPVFDAFKARLLESNSKVNLHALKSLQKIIVLMKDNLSPVVNILVPAIVDNHLNSKSIAICAAANGALDALLLHLDNILLLQPFCTKSQFLSGKAKVDLVHKVADLVTELYPRKPQMVVQKVLPLLWHLLGTSGHSGTVHGRAGSVRGATADLCHALHAQMGPGLAEVGALQPSNVQKALNDVLRAGSAAKQQHQAERSSDAELT